MATDPLIELIRGTDILNLNDLDTYLRIEEDGLGLPEVRRITERGPFQHGDTDLDFRLEPRIINVVCGVFGEIFQGTGPPVVLYNNSCGPVVFLSAYAIRFQQAMCDRLMSYTLADSPGAVMIG